LERSQTSRLKLNLLRQNFLDCIYSPHWLSLYIDNNVYVNSAVYKQKQPGYSDTTVRIPTCKTNYTTQENRKNEKWDT
jgi:hypothetical protein